MNIGLVGLGSIGRDIVEGWHALPASLRLTAVCVRQHHREAAHALVGEDTMIVTSIEDLLATMPDIVIEAAGQETTRACALPILAAGVDLYLLSTGVLADAALHDAMVAMATASGASIMIPAGAMAGFDGLQSLRGQGLSEVAYTSVKPPAAWQGTPAQESHDLDRLPATTILFDGTAREAARRFPKNANLAAAIALAGIGLDRTRVILVADPAMVGNLGRLEASGPHGRLLVEVDGEASGSNPKSSAIVGKSVLASLANRVAALRYV